MTTCDTTFFAFLLNFNYQQQSTTIQQTKKKNNEFLPRVCDLLRINLGQIGVNFFFSVDLFKNVVDCFFYWNTCWVIVYKYSDRGNDQIYDWINLS